MEELKIMFLMLGSFFGMKDGRIAAEKTTVTVNPLHRKVTSIQENLFAVIQSESDAPKVLEQWQKFNTWNEKETPWSVELDSFSEKKLLLFAGQKINRTASCIAT
jgi:acyl-ACP thioesterase